MATQVLDQFVTRFSAETDRASVNRTRAFFQSLRSGLNRLGIQAGITGGLITAATAGFVKAFANLETQFAKIEGLVGIQAGVIDKQFRPAIEKLSASFGVMPEKLAEGLFFITSAGQRGAMALDTLTISAKAQVAQLGETNVVADLLTSAINAYGSANLTAAQAADELAMGVRLGKLEAASLAPVMGTLLPLSSKLGVSFREVVGLMAAQSRTGTEAAIGATQLNSVFSDLIKTSVKGEEAIRDKLGLSMEGLRATIADKGLLHVLQMLDKAFGGNVESLALVFDNVRALRSILDLLGENSAATSEIIDGMNNSTGTLDEAFQAQARTINFQFNRAQAAAKLAVIQLGEAMAPVVGLMLDHLIPALLSASERFKELPPWIQSAVGWLALLGPVLLILGAALPILGAALEGLALLFGAISAPVIGVIALLVGLAFGAAYFWGPQITAAWELVKAAFVDPILAEIKRQWTGPSWESIKQAWSDRSLDPILAEVFPELVDSEDIWNAIGSTVLGRIVHLGKFTAVLLFPELDETEITWAKVGTALSTRLKGLGTLAVIVLFPELAGDDITWAAVGTSLSGKLTGLRDSAAVWLFPELSTGETTWDLVGADLERKILALGGDISLMPTLDKSSVTWMAIWSALRKRIGNSAQWLAIKLLPELDETEITWAAIWTALSGKIAGAGTALALLLFPELDETEITWAAIWTALSGKIAGAGTALALLLFPELDETEITWAAIWTALSGKIAGAGTALALLLFPELEEGEITWAAVGAALVRKIIELGGAAIIWLLPSLNERRFDVGNYQAEAAASSSIAELVGDLGRGYRLCPSRISGCRSNSGTVGQVSEGCLDDLGLGEIGIFDPFTNFWEGFTESATAAGGSAAVKELVNSLIALFTSMVSLGSELSKLQLAVVFAPLMALIRAVGGYEGSNGEVLMQFLKDVGGWVGVEGVETVNAAAVAIRGLADALNYFATMAGMPINAAMSFIEGFNNPGGKTAWEQEAEADRTPGMDVESFVARGSSGSGRLAARLLGRDTPEPGLPPGESSTGGLLSGLQDKSNRAAQEAAQQRAKKTPWWENAYNYVFNSGTPEGHEGGITGGPGEFLARLQPGELITPLDQLDKVIGSVLNVPSLATAIAGAGGGSGSTYNFQATLNLTVPEGDRQKGRELLDYGASVLRQQMRDLADELESDVVV